MSGKTDASGFATNLVPCVYADDVANLAKGSNVFKFYLERVDPAPSEPVDKEGGSNTVPVVQVVMPVEGFLRAVAFFVQSLRAMVGEEKFTEDELEILGRLGIKLEGGDGDASE